MSTERHITREIQLGSVTVGGTAPVSVQTMTKTDTRDVAATSAQIRSVADAGCDIVRVAVVDEAAAAALPAICADSPIPVVADIHFRHVLALAALDAGVDGLRINPGNLGGGAELAEVVAAARAGSVPIRVGVNSGSLESDLEAKYGGRPAEALAESALRNVDRIRQLGYDKIKISAKASDVLTTIRAYRILGDRTDLPLHLGVTEAGTFLAGTVRSAAGIGALLADGIGDTIRVSLTDTPEQEVRVGLMILRSFGLREPGPSVISCPTCGRVQVDVATVARSVESELEIYYRESPNAHRPTVAVMGCLVNGPGEARDADIAVAGGAGKFALYIDGEQVSVVPEGDAVAAVVEAVRNWRPAAT